MAERLVHDTGSRATFYTASDEPEPADLIRINLEASLLALAGKLQVGIHLTINQYSHVYMCILQILLKLQIKASNNNSQLEQAPSLVALLGKYEERLYSESTDNSNQDTEDQNTLAENNLSKNEKNNRKWIAELSPCLSKLISAAQALVKTLRLIHGVQRLKEELPRSATAHSLQHRRDVCFSQAVQLYLHFFFYIFK